MRAIIGFTTIALSAIVSLAEAQSDITGVTLKRPLLSPWKGTLMALNSSMSAIGTTSNLGFDLQLGGTFTEQIATAFWPLNKCEECAHMEVMGRGTDGHLYRKGWDRPNWDKNWQDLGAPMSQQITGTPAVTSFNDGTDYMGIFARGPNNTLWAKTWLGTWTDWYKIGDNIISDPTAAGNPGHFYVFAKRSDAALQMRMFDQSKGWGEWKNIDQGLSAGVNGGPMSSRIYAEGRNPTQTPMPIDVYYGRVDGVMYRARISPEGNRIGTSKVGIKPAQYGLVAYNDGSMMFTSIDAGGHTFVSKARDTTRTQFEPWGDPIQIVEWSKLPYVSDLKVTEAGLNGIAVCPTGYLQDPQDMNAMMSASSGDVPPQLYLCVARTADPLQAISGIKLQYGDPTKPNAPCFGEYTLTMDPIDLNKGTQGGKPIFMCVERNRPGRHVTTYTWSLPSLGFTTELSSICGITLAYQRAEDAANKRTVVPFGSKDDPANFNYPLKNWEMYLCYNWN